jgi:exodeoxyribonuclease V beta subunit
VRGALASVSWNLTREELEYLLNHESAWQAQVEQFHQWQQIWLTHGVLPLLHQWLHAPLLGQSIAQRLLKNADGERSLSNLLHLGELLQHASARLQGSAAVLRHLEQHIIQPPREVESQKSRLETDDQCVQIITYHKSKGLQYPLVFIPFAGSFRYDSQSEQDDDEEPNSAEEDMRLLYVALTRAQRAMWVGLAETQKDISKGSATSDPKRSAVSVLFEREVRGDLHRKLQQRVTECADMALKTLLVDEPLTTVHYTQANTSTIHVAAQRNQRGRFNNWWIASYSTLTKGLIPQSVQDEKMDDTASDTQGEDGTTTLFSPTISLAPPTQRWQEIAGGARFGSFLHELLEWQSQNGWPLGHTNDALLEKSWRQLFLRKTQWMGIDQTQAHTLHEWIEHLVTVTLKLPDLNDVNQTSVLQLQQLDALQSQTEMAFHLPANQVSTQWLDQCIRKHIFADAPRPALQTRELNGMLTGFMDLVFTHQGRFWIMDYKSNKLPQYNEDSLTETVLEKRYDVQYVLYTLALHRLLKTRLQNYDYDQHIGAAVYFFLRGVDEPNQGLHIMRPPRELIESLDNAFAGEVLA